MTQADRFAAFRHLSFRRYFASRFGAAFGAQVLSVSVGWQIYEETRQRETLVRALARGRPQAEPETAQRPNLPLAHGKAG